MLWLAAYLIVSAICICLLLIAANNAPTLPWHD